ncbi:MAG TPA: hypothetical protein VD926_09035, partial [Acidimicrobiales bacterium]|nr:hypothetical protein [Acidimicrobiales bacterium]
MKMQNVTRRTRFTRLAPFIGLLGLLMLVAPPVRGQAVFHTCVLSWEDGDPIHDSDGAKNGVLTFGGGKTHVIKSCHMSNTEKLVIQSGAVIKVAADCKFDANYKVQSCRPVPFCCQQNFWAYGPESAIQIDGATITDVRDHTVGAQITIEPYPGAPTTPVMAWDLLFNRSGDNRITNSTIKYAAKMMHVGDMRITGNRFLVFGGIQSEGLVNTSPIITDNLFELAYPSATGSRIDLRGKSVLFSGNTVRGVLVVTPPSYPAGSNVITTGLIIGPLGENMGYPDDPRYPWGPRTGTTIVTGNTFETTTGVEMERGTAVFETYRGYERVRFRATISNNTFRGTSNPATGAPGGQALSLVMDAEAEVSSNEVSNYAAAFTAYASQRLTQNRLRITGNRFSLEGSNVNAPVFGGAYTRGLFVNAEHNYWGDPSGPLDRSRADGLYNPRGKGIVVADGVDYVPFIGGQAVYTDDVHIVVSATRWFENNDGDLETAPASEFAAEDSVEFVVRADIIRLRTAERGRLVVHLLDPQGKKVFTSPPVAITADDAEKEIPAFGLRIPGNGAYLDVQAEIIPGDETEGEPSNAARFPVKGARSRFTFQAVDPTTKGSLDAAVQGATSTALAQLFYTFSTAGPNGTFEFTAEERRRGTNVVLNRFGVQPLSVPPGKDLQAEQRINFTFPIPSVPTKTEFFIKIRLRDDKGQVVASDSASVNVRSPGIVRFGNHSDEEEAEDETPVVSPATISGSTLNLTGRTYFRPGDDVAGRVGVTWRINVPGTSGWQVAVDKVESLNASGGRIEGYAATGSRVGLGTTQVGTYGTVDVVAAGKKVPASAAKLRFVVRLR